MNYKSSLKTPEDLVHYAVFAVVLGVYVWTTLKSNMGLAPEAQKAVIDAGLEMVKTPEQLHQLIQSVRPKSLDMSQIYQQLSMLSPLLLSMWGHNKERKQYKGTFSNSKLPT